MGDQGQIVKSVPYPKAFQNQITAYMQTAKKICFIREQMRERSFPS
jgi:hypothetical protein